jgi:hypothetical protein
MSSTVDYMLTTYDNPIDPFTHFEAWLKEDIRLGHDCCGRLARESATSNILSNDVNEQKIDEAMDRIIEMEPIIYRKVLPSDFIVNESV